MRLSVSPSLPEAMEGTTDDGVTASNVAWEGSLAHSVPAAPPIFTPVIFSSTSLKLGGTLTLASRAEGALQIKVGHLLQVPAHVHGPAG